ncbi:MAG: PAS domain-containing protein, partial [Ktedonobacterales bacterium]
MRRQSSAAPHQPAPPDGAPLADLTSRPFSAQESREQLLAFMRAITDNLGEGTYALDLDGRVTFMNPAAERMLGWTAAELHGKDMH